MTVKLTHAQVKCLHEVWNWPGHAARLVHLNGAGYSTATVTRLRESGHVNVENGIVTLTENGKAFIRFSVN